MKYAPIILLLFLLLGCNLSYKMSNKEWTVPQLKEWSARESKSPSTWKGRILYQGSDTACHHYISRHMDEWVWFRVKRADLMIVDEKPYPTKTTSSSPLGYYYVDPTKDFEKIGDY
jgi:hypothetical protein